MEGLAGEQTPALWHLVLAGTVELVALDASDTTVCEDMCDVVNQAC